MTNENNMARRFIMNEGQVRSESLSTHIQALDDILRLFVPRSKTDQRRLEGAFQHLRSLRNMAKRIEEENEKE